MWEDEANANGGQRVFTMKNTPGLLDRCLSRLTMVLVGKELEEGDEIAEQPSVSEVRATSRG